MSKSQHTSQNLIGYIFDQLALDSLARPLNIFNFWWIRYFVEQNNLNHIVTDIFIYNKTFKSDYLIAIITDMYKSMEVQK